MYSPPMEIVPVSVPLPQTFTEDMRNALPPAPPLTATPVPVPAPSTIEEQVAVVNVQIALATKSMLAFKESDAFEDAAKEKRKISEMEEYIAGLLRQETIPFDVAKYAFKIPEKCGMLASLSKYPPKFMFDSEQYPLVLSDEEVIDFDARMIKKSYKGAGYNSQYLYHQATGKKGETPPQPRFERFIDVCIEKREGGYIKLKNLIASPPNTILSYPRLLGAMGMIFATLEEMTQGAPTSSDNIDVINYTSEFLRASADYLNPTVDHASIAGGDICSYANIVKELRLGKMSEQKREALKLNKKNMAVDAEIEEFERDFERKRLVLSEKKANNAKQAVARSMKVAGKYKRRTEADRGKKKKKEVSDVDDSDSDEDNNVSLPTFCFRGGRGAIFMGEEGQFLSDMKGRKKDDDSDEEGDGGEGAVDGVMSGERVAELELENWKLKEELEETRKANEKLMNPDHDDIDFEGMAMQDAIAHYFNEAKEVAYELEEKEDEIKETQAVIKEQGEEIFETHVPAFQFLLKQFNGICTALDLPSGEDGDVVIRRIGELMEGKIITGVGVDGGGSGGEEGERSLAFPSTVKPKALAFPSTVKPKVMAPPSTEKPKQDELAGF